MADNATSLTCYCLLFRLVGLRSVSISIGILGYRARLKNVLLLQTLEFNSGKLNLP